VENGPDQDSEVTFVDAGDGVDEVSGAWSARLAASRSIRFSPAELGSSPMSRAPIAASQSIAAVPVPWWMKEAKSSRPSQVPWAMISPVAASSVKRPSAAARSPDGR
jgi:hypothetical protein